MEILQKLTLYDLLGYALPGAVLLLIYSGNDLNELSDLGAEGGLLLLLFSFLTGIISSEIMQWVDRILNRFFGIKQWQNLCTQYSLSGKRMKQALKKAQIMNESDMDSDTDDEAMENYRRYQNAIYADIQTDPKYSRIHNYASAALLYKNMVFVSVFYIVNDFCEKELHNIVIGAIVLLCFYTRWMRFKSKKMGYAACWFLEKYGNETMPKEK